MLGIDFGIALARKMLCVRTSIADEMLEEAIAYLNHLNRQYPERQRPYHWSVYYDNCVHVLRNALAAARLWEPKAVDDMPFLQALHLPVPANESLKLALRSDEFPIEDFDTIWDDAEAKLAALERKSSVNNNDGSSSWKRSFLPRVRTEARCAQSSRRARHRRRYR